MKGERKSFKPIFILSGLPGRQDIQHDDTEHNDNLRGI
jgi:hypothetical protein